ATGARCLNTFTHLLTEPPSPRPRGLLRPLLRAPVPLYRCGLGWLLGGRVLLLSHTERARGYILKTG
ncbi:MAG: hypothetical protein AAB502_05315, partial [Chloroflexota bacterium]